MPSETDKSIKNKLARGQAASQLDVTEKHLAHILYGVSEDKKYTKFEIPKRSGGTRLIKAPIAALKNIQSTLSEKLYAHIEAIEKKENKPFVSFAFRKSASIIDNAKRHKNRRWVLNLDLQDFFPSFNFGRVRGFFIKDKDFKYSEEIATILAQIACHEGTLPQGGPCSPVISELIARILDMRMLGLAKKYKLTYTRYADDITFSTNQREFPAAIAQQHDSSAIWKIGKALRQRITDSGFVINEAKTRMSFRNGRQMVTGLVVNKKVNIADSYYRQARAMCYFLFQNGFYYYKNYAKGPSKLTRLNPLEGRLGHIYNVKEKVDRRVLRDKRDKPSAMRKLYRDFLFYKYFLAWNKPLIITEGKTDLIHLKEAVRHLPAFQPEFGKQEDGKFIHALSYFNYEGKIAHEVLRLYGGGTGNLKNILFDYRDFLHDKSDKYKHKPMNFPVIIFLDNDSGLKKFASTVEEVTKNIKAVPKVSFSIDSEDNFYHIMDNLYVVKTPGKDSYIEKFYDEEIIKMKIDGKTFCPDNKNEKAEGTGGFDNKKHYGKTKFAKEVIQAQANKIDFSGFKPLLERIGQVIQDYAKKT